MEGNACYRFSTIRRFVEKTGARPIETIVEVGTNVGNVTLEMLNYFPTAWVWACEPCEPYFSIANERLSGDGRVSLHRVAVTAQHLFEDDLGRLPRQSTAPLQLLRALPVAGPGWEGGSQILAADSSFDSNIFTPLDEVVEAIDLNKLVSDVCLRRSVSEIDLLKSDCEGAENSFLGCASAETLQRIRFVVGEYHDLSRFFNVCKNQLFSTHRVSLVGDRSLGAFLAERMSSGSGLLNDNPLEAQLYPHLADEPLWWHTFNREYVGAGEEWMHGIT